MSKYLELFNAGFDSTVPTKIKQENRPYVGLSKTDGLVYTTVYPTNDEVWYTSTDKLVAELTRTTDPSGGSSFGEASLVDNTYDIKGVLKFDKEVHKLGYNIFTGSKTLRSVVIPNSVTSIEWGAFNNCTSLTSVTLGSGVTSITYMAFAECSALRSIVIPEGVLEIGQNAFNNCKLLRSVSLPASLSVLASDSFSDCLKLESIIFAGTKALWASINKASDWNNRSAITQILCTDGVVSL